MNIDIREPFNHRYFGHCKKNPDHERFVPSRQFNIDDLPGGYQDFNLETCVHLMSELSVFVKAKYVSEDRPQFVPGTDRSHPLFSFRGTNRTVVGSGWVHTVYRFPDKYNDQHKTCPCKQCLRSEIPNTQFACIAICTASHVVFDDSEGEHTSCYLFYNEACRPDECKGAVELRGMWRVFSDISNDRCLMIHVTHDLELAARLHRLVLSRDSAKESYINRRLLSSRQENVHNDQTLLVILVSHPHGRSSCVTVGFERGLVDKKAGRVQYMYDTPTCPGSSGGKIFVVWKHWGLWGFEHTHSRRCPQEKSLNHSANGIGYLPPILSQPAPGGDSGESRTNDVPDQEAQAPGGDSGDSRTNDLPDQEAQGLAEVEEYLAETELHSKYTVCRKNPGHQNFIPIHEFSEHHLPPGRRHLVRHIKALGNIVALVAVKKVSQERPKTFPGTATPYPRTALVGTCWVYQVIREVGRCQCEECQKYGDPKTRFAYIIIHTAAHVVFDDNEKEHTTCYLFFDKGSTLDNCAGVVTLSGMSRVWSDVEKDVCKMLYVTHDPDVIDCVEEVVDEWESARRSLECQKFIDRATAPGEGSSADPSHQALAIAVSHPHGCSKQVSIGQCVSIDDSGNGQTVYKYTTPTCRGSSGAYVFVEGRVRKSWDDNEHMGVELSVNCSN